MRAYWGDRMHLLPCGKPADTIPGRSCRRNLASGNGPKTVNSCAVDKWYDSDIEEEVRRLHKTLQFDAIWVEYVFLSKVLELFDDTVTKIIDTHDVFANRDQVLISGGIAPQWFYTDPAAEKAALSRAHVVIAIKEEDEKYFRSLGLTTVTTIGHSFPVAHCSTKPNALRTILYVASHNPINVKSWDFFLEKIFFPVKEKVPGISINVAGKICGSIPDSKYYKKLGIVDDLRSLYQSATLAINPVTFGTGLKIKTVEPLAFGCPVVTTPVGIEGIDDAKGRGILVGRTPEEFVEHIELLLTKPSFRREQSVYALDYSERYLIKNRQRLKWVLSYCDNRNVNSIETH